MPRNVTVTLTRDEADALAGPPDLIDGGHRVRNARRKIHAATREADDIAQRTAACNARGNHCSHCREAGYDCPALSLDDASSQHEQPPA